VVLGAEARLVLVVVVVALGLSLPAVVASSEVPARLSRSSSLFLSFLPVGWKSTSQQLCVEGLSRRSEGTYGSCAERSGSVSSCARRDLRSWSSPHPGLLKG
jgi:hypothetical protein